MHVAVASDYDTRRHITDKSGDEDESVDDRHWNNLDEILTSRTEQRLEVGRLARAVGSVASGEHGVDEVGAERCRKNGGH